MSPQGRRGAECCLGRVRHARAGHAGRSRPKYDSDLFDNIDASVFRHRYVVTLDDLSLMKDTQTALKNVDGIADVTAFGLRGKLHHVPEH